MVGLDSAGKTTILQWMRFGEAVRTTPTTGFNVETIQHKNVRMHVWDVGGQEKMRRLLWKQFYFGSNALIFVVDSNDRARIEDASEELHHLLRAEELKDASVLVYANKQDLPHAVNTEDLTLLLSLNTLPQRRQWLVQPTCATRGEGILEGMDWLAESTQRGKQDWFGFAQMVQQARDQWQFQWTQQ